MRLLRGVVNRGEICLVSRECISPTARYVVKPMYMYLL